MSSIENDPAPPASSPLAVLILTGVINFILGSLLAGFVTAYFAEQHSDRELQRTWLQERSKHQMTVRKEFLDEQSGTVATLYQLISRLKVDSIDLVDITSPEYSKKSHEKQKSDTRDEFDNAVDAWERQRYFYDFALASYHGGGRDVHAAWSETRDAATAIAQCASKRWFDSDKGVPYPTKRPCEDEEKVLDAKWEVLSGQLRAARETAWSDRENPPQRLK
ncbi:MAG TPA: hypothetical protein VLC46_09055 [Thermoanaerobaculia bacterium]|jgi:hypothetical protein|nr:hypothetical protein [Thermoanaerobaculia bacterium]